MAKKGKNGSVDLTLQVLRQIRDGVKATREEVSRRIDETNTRLDATNQRLDTANQCLDETNRRLVESETRPASAILGMKGALDEVRDFLKGQSDLRPRVERLERHVGIAPSSST